MERSRTSISCLRLIICAIIGGWCLQYDLNHWIPVLHRAFPDAIHDPGPITSIFPWLALGGIFLGGPALVVAILTAILSGVGII